MMMGKEGKEKRYSSVEHLNGERDARTDEEEVEEEKARPNTKDHRSSNHSREARIDRHTDRSSNRH